jgi:hypothetical protein
MWFFLPFAFMKYLYSVVLRKSAFPAAACDLWYVAKLTAQIAIVLAINSAFVSAYTPESPEVKKIVQKGIDFLCSDAANDGRPGAQALQGMALLKAEIRPDHPKILQAVEAVRGMIPNNDPKTASVDSIYTAGLSIIFLVNLDPVKYKPEIECLLQFLYDKQKKHGGWGYYTLETGDTSMTQYGVLSSWEAKQAGFNIPPDAMDRVAHWLLHTQDPSGGYSYQGKIAPEGSLIPQNQDEIRHSLTAAGGGCVYILSDLFQLDGGAKRREDLPAALKELRGKSLKKTVGMPTHISSKSLHEAQSRTTEWENKNYAISTPFGYAYYYLYALERYMSFRELIEPASEKNAKAKWNNWYNDGVDFIIKHESRDGGWDDHCGKIPDTAFAMLFLMRSTKKAIMKAKTLGPGVLISGQGLPKEGENLQVQNGLVVVKPDMGPAEDLLKMLDDPKAADYEKAMEMMSELPSQQLETLLAAHGEKLRHLTREQDMEARLAAVVALGKIRNLDNVPALIYALTDPDRDVVIEARKSLERISRNPTGYGPIDDYTEEQRRAAVEKWKAWYRSIRPDADVDF